MNQRPILRSTIQLLVIAILIHPQPCSAAPQARVFQVRDFGAKPDAQADCAPAVRQAVQAAVAAGPGAEVAFEPGTYRVKAIDAYCFPLDRVTGLIVRGAGPATKIVVADPTQGAFHVLLSTNVTLRDFTVDYDPLPFCQGTILTVDQAAGHFDLEVEAGHSTPDAANFANSHQDYGKWGMIIDRATRRIKAGTPDHYMTPRWQHLSERAWRFFTKDSHHQRNLQFMKPGDAYVHLARGHAGAAIMAQGCENIRIENVVIHASPGIAVGLVGNRGEIAVQGLQVRFPPNSTRLLTTNADGVHCQQNRAGPRIQHCYFEGMADDAVNIYAPPNTLLEVREPTRWLVSPACLLLPGDRLQALDPKTGILRGEVRATEVSVEGQCLLLTLEKPLEGAAPGHNYRVADTLYNLSACGAGFHISNNQINGNRRYGCLLRAGAGTVENNTFCDMTGAGVVLTNEPDWPEGPVPWNIAIRQNRFLRGGTCLGYADSPQGAALVVRATRLGHGLAEGKSIRDVIIENNTFLEPLGAAVYLGGTSAVTLRSNMVRASTETQLRRTTSTFLIERSADAVLKDNEVADPRPGITSALAILPDVDPGPAGVRVDGLKTSLHSNSTDIDDRRPRP